ncbi:hypothetical protein ES703_119691 [subsurface metagenome]
MAILTAMPDEHIIAGFHGVIDFFYWKGIPLCKKWPRPPTGPRAPSVAIRYEPFAYIMKVSKELPPYLRQNYEAMAQGTGLRWQDYLVRSYMSGISYNP